MTDQSDLTEAFPELDEPSPAFPTFDPERAKELAEQIFKKLPPRLRREMLEICAEQIIGFELDTPEKLDAYAKGLVAAYTIASGAPPGSTPADILEVISLNVAAVYEHQRRADG